MNSFRSYLTSRLAEPLPGREAQSRMAPEPVNGLRPKRLYHPENDSYRNSSVLVPLIEKDEEIWLILTLRTTGIKHGGQISFPGGGREGDETHEETALREAHEEIGLITEQAEIIGHLTPLYVNHSDNMVTPVVAFLQEDQDFSPNPNEVDEVIRVTLDQLINDENLSRDEWDLSGMSFHVPYWDVHHVPLWGATAMMLNELIELYHHYLGES
ncbi:NUDIX hydrolase [Balneola sp. MJW-20]|uniref:NUDIX hydrolase n=1 Tax=Gracilimonas aurantiaca TaxID=3234185 RepID=UPI0034651E7A